MVVLVLANDNIKGSSDVIVCYSQNQKKIDPNCIKELVIFQSISKYIVVINAIITISILPPPPNLYPAP